ncbi:MAG: transporter related protein [Burkholderia sp.]|jgi:sulfonate transport system ATP-binding protein|nr:transporter related protein [Burkholderia sp.]
MTKLLTISVQEKRHGQRLVLRGLHLAVSAGEIVSLVGASGCGKSTLLSIIAGLDPAYRGDIVLDGRRLDGPSADVGLIFQEPRLLPWLPVRDNIAFGAADGKPDAGLVDALLAEVGLQDYGSVLPRQLSGGQAQRVAIARGLYTRPRLLLLDEPFSAVDAFTRMKLQALLLSVAREHGLTIVLVTHDIDEALYLSDRIVMLDKVPGPPRAEFPIPLPRPRGRADPALAVTKARILEQLDDAHAL